MGVNLGKFFSNVGKGVGKVAGFAAPFIPGIGGAIAGLAGGLMGQDDSQRKADKSAEQLGGYGNALTKMGMQNLPLISDALMSQAGINGGKFDASYNPYKPLHDSLYSDGAITGRATGLFDPASLTGDMLAQQEAADGQYDNAVSAAKSDMLGRGFGFGSTIGDSNIASIRTAQAQEGAGARRNMLSRLLEQKRGYIIDQQGAGQNLLQSGLGAKERALSSATSLATGNVSQGMGTLGGLQGLYQSKADNAAKGLGDFVQQVGKAGIFDQLFKKKRTQSGSLGTTNAQAPPPVRLGMSNASLPVSFNPKPATYNFLQKQG
jgi:hypothetical protein